MSIKFNPDVKCQIFTDKGCGTGEGWQYVRLEKQEPDLTRHNVAIPGRYFQSVRCAGGM